MKIWISLRKTFLPFLLLVAAKCSFASDKLHFGSDFEPLHKEGHVYPMAVVLYDESGLSPFHKNLRDFDLGEIKISIKQNWKDIGVAAVVWEAAVALGDFLVQNPTIVKHKRVLELGAGTGLAGLVAAKLGGDVVLTDRKQSLGVLEENLSLAAEQDELRVRIRELNWGEDLTEELSKPFDVIVGADVIYIEETFPLLLKTLVDVSDCKSHILLAQKIRYERDEKFLQLLSGKFVVRELDYEAKTGVHIYTVKRKC